MNILISGNVITGYMTKYNYPGTIHIDDENVPYSFKENFKIGKWLYKDGKIVENPDYVPPSPPEPPLEEQIEALQEQNQMLTDCILEMSEIVYGGGDT